LLQMPSSTKCGVQLTDVLWTGLSGDFTRHFPETLLLSVSGQLEKNAFRTSLIPCVFDSPEMCALHPLQAGVDIVVTTSWLGHESIQTAYGRTLGRPILQDPRHAETISRRSIFSDTQSRQASAEAPRRALIKCGVDSPAIRSQTSSLQFTPHFIVLGILDEMRSSAFCPIAPQYPCSR
jgi:hypothetical protein